ncbi:hypothetical protein A2803_05665 [Candidatus Woesebacteria bacterium RIFCSPHIGHO2_01_FULL_44_21]|uniref:Uncharacterized protein n=1 Tax=Candidatus Woesebacteria bacterium RIFCSPHIGHO2_01_FULL_44_21 TaxID=1802503 RepID=A0A1F7YZU6_9BACT|nr:MAG: hypothetical protein A2803_05665 [Candidatus Woesebacteria bacterium RIFCSPHIGHO2_01_FULL_44_21]OGM71118.1 MAG: hypothetical protein A2897_02760 [Candidatus Woesebacteria bacterium RIFCSPLOWO2_01_FULL_44_24b]
MKRILRVILVELAGLYIAAQVAGGLTFQNQAEGFIITGIVLGVAMFSVRPLINILLLPLNLATLGLFRIVGHTLTLFIVDVALSEFEVTGFHFSGFSTTFFDFPAIDFERGAWAYLAFSILIWFFTALINWIRK